MHDGMCQHYKASEAALKTTILDQSTLHFCSVYIYIYHAVDMSVRLSLKYTCKLTLYIAGMNIIYTYASKQT